MSKVHFCVLVIEDSTLYDLSQIKGDILNDSVVQEGAFCRHFTYVSSWNEVGSDEMMPHFGNVGQMLGLEMHCMVLTVHFPFPLAKRKDENDNSNN